MASVIGLAPIRPDLKGRLRELLCIHGQKWSPRLVSRQRLLVFSEALICLSYSGEMVVPAGNAPASSGYQPGAGGRLQRPFELRDEFKLRFHTKAPHRTKGDGRFC